MNKTRTAFVVLGLTAAIVLLAIAAWQLGWWLKAKNTDRGVRIQNQNVGTQSAWQQQVTEGIRTVALLEDGPQRRAVVNEACLLASKLTPNFRTASIDAFTAANCG